MIKYIVSTGIERKIKIKPQDLMERSVGEIIADRYKDGKIISFDGSTAVVIDGKDVTVMVDPKDLITESAEKIIKRKLKTQKKLKISVGK